MSESGDGGLIEEPPPRKTRGARGRHEVAKDVARVEKLLREGTPTYAIYAKLPKLATRTVDRYIAQVRARWKASLLARSETALEERILQLQETRAMFLRERKAVVVDGQVLHQGSRYDAAIAKYDEMINDLLGVGGPAIEVKHSGQVETLHVHVDYSKLDEGELHVLRQIASRDAVTLVEGDAATQAGGAEPPGDDRGDRR